MQEINPIHYRIHLEPDLDNFSFQGHTEIDIHSTGPAKEILLHALDLDVQTCRAGMEDLFEECTFSMDPENEEMKVLLPKEMSGEMTLAIDYVGEINNRMAGFYRSKYVQNGQEKYVGVTQFEESDARRAFPCFDHPLKKATFDVEMVIDETLVAISNSAVAEEKTVEGGKKTIRFQRTPKMSTYLLFFGVGEFDFIEDPGEVLVRVATMPGMSKQGMFGLEFGRKSLEFSEDYYAIPYPFPKLDLIAIEDFAFGAMENWGAITFRENLLLHDPDVTSKSGENRICEVIAHEIAHQWFGNLVTPSDWKYLWLNESFATYFGYGVVGHYYPDWGVWDQFLKDGTNVALERDALIETTPIEIPGGEHVVINVSTAPIIYQKGGSILRQVEGHIGPENFKNGLRDYLKEHQYACASSHHLWESLEKASREPVTKMMKRWIEQPGFPMVEVAREGDTLVLTQQRFTYLPNDSKAEWLIPLGIEVHYPDGNRETMTTLLDGETTTIAIGKQAQSYKVNTGQTGFYRVKYLEPSNMEELGRRVADKSLSHEDRWGLENDLYAFLKKGEVSLEQYLGFLSNYSREDACLPISSIASNLATLYLLGDESHRESILSTGRPFFEEVM
ncbi:MAG: M1 family metallopeptidase [Deltaproteobacteria bacterium]|nr:M1 family metallopeptidase [Deltaproteobacteria bacterium]